MRKSPSALERIRALREYLNTHFTLDLHTEELADRACLSVSHFAELFQQENGVSPKQYLIQKRLDFARQLLLQSDLPVDAVAERCGYHDLTHFYISFKRKVGVSPAVYRRQHVSTLT